jgi:glycosyltransferase involved in cell wall biosynthesis
MTEPVAVGTRRQRQRDVPPADEGERRFAYVSSRYPEPLQTYISREVVAVGHALGAAPPFLSLKRAPLGIRMADSAAHAPTLRGAVRALPRVFRSVRTRRFVRDVLGAYRRRPADRAKALVTVVLAAALVPVLRRYGIQHLHAHFAAMPGLAAYFLHHLTGVSYSIAAHGWDIYVDTVMLREKLESAEFVVACTRAGQTALAQRGAPSDRTVLCYHGVAFDGVRPPVFVRDDLTLRIVAVGRLVEQKGFGHLVEACWLLRRRGLRFECRIIGDGPLRADLRRRISEFGLDRVVRLEGTLSQQDVFAAYRRGGVLCAPSVVAADGDRDGIPNVILEAMSQGLPVVGSRISGIPEAIEHGTTGWLVDPADPHGLAEALLEVSSEPADALRRAQAAYARATAAFDVERNVLPLVELLIRRRAARRGAAGQPVLDVMEARA